MELSEFKNLIKAYYTSGQPMSAVAAVLNQFDLDGTQEDVLEYLHSTYAIRDSYYAKNLTDTGNAERMIKVYGDDIHYCYDRKKWLVWNGDVWQWDDGDRVMQFAKDIARNIYAEAAEEKDDKRREAIAKHAHNSESDSKRKAMLELAQSEIGIPINMSSLDFDPWQFNCVNGTIDLRTGKINPHNKADLNTILVNIEYNRAARCDLWLKFLARVTDNNHELMEYLQKAVGYSLTGDSREQCLFFLYGLGRNGKSTFLSIIRKLTGAYGTKTSTDLFMQKDRNSGGPSEGLADLQGKRFVVASEIEDGRRIATVMIKEMTGGETIRADRKYEHQFEFQPTHKIWLSGNHKPVITDTTFSIWRRWRMIPFTTIIPDSECDPQLAVKLEHELPGILAWAVRGCIEWSLNGLGNPDKVVSATESYRQEQDVLGEFIEDYCVLNSIAYVPKGDLYKAYCQWCSSNNQDPIGQRSFRGKIVERGLLDSRGTGGVRLWRGITLRNKELYQGDLVTNSDASDVSDRIMQEKTAVSLVKDTLYVNPVTRVTSVTGNVTKNDIVLEKIPNGPCVVCGNEDWQYTPEGKVICGNGHIQYNERS